MNPSPETSPTCILCGFPTRGGSDGFCCLGCYHTFEILKEMLGKSDPAAMRGHPLFQQMLAAGIIRAGDGDFDIGESQSEPALQPVEGTEQHVFKVDGMWCPSCSWVIEHVLMKGKGIIMAMASFSSDRVKVTYLSRLTGPEQIARSIEGLGYKVVYEDQGRKRAHSLRTDFIRLGISIVLSVNVMMLSFGVYQGLFIKLPSSVARSLGVPIMLMSTAVVFYCGFPILTRAIGAARARAFVMETLISIAVLAAYGLSVADLIQGSFNLYFDTACMLVTLVLLGKYLESRIRHRVTQRIEEIYELVPGKARLVTDHGQRYVSTKTVLPGDLVRVSGGEQIPVDGVVVKGNGFADQSRLTGEARLNTKNAGDTVLGASLLVSGEITIRVTGAGESSAIGRMIRLMEEAILSKNPAERITDRIMAVFGPAVLALAFATGVILLFQGQSYGTALVRLITILAIACPCAVGIAIPLARVAAVGRAWREGILVVNPEALEKACKLTAIVMDKTGTVTRGEYRVVHIEARGAPQEEVVSFASAAEAESEHPIGKAVRDYAETMNSGRRTATRISQVPGFGVRANVDGHLVLVGKTELMEMEGIHVDPDWEEPARLWSASGDTTVFVSWDHEVRGLIRLGDTLRKDMANAVARLREQGIKVHLVSGDAPAATEHIARQLGTDRFEGGLLPADKVEWVRSLMRMGHRVGMVGDGANDAAALAVADVGFATGEALAVTKHASDITLLSFSGARLLAALDLSKVTMKIIGTNLAFSLLYNLISVPLAIAGLVNPVIAVSIMMLSSLTVVGNSARISRATQREKS